MRFIELAGERDIDDLAASLYRGRGRRSRAATERAKAELRRANPHLAGLERLPEGAILAVPDVAGLRIAPEAAATPATEASAPLVASVRAAVEEFERDLRKAARADAQSIRQDLALLASEELARDLREQAPWAVERVEEASRRIEERGREREALARRTATALRRAASELEELEKRLTG
jgi:hypothetical protein